MSHMNLMDLRDKSSWPIYLQSMVWKDGYDWTKCKIIYMSKKKPFLNVTC